MISKTEIKRIASRICTADVRCPVFDAGADCSCDAEHGDCPIVKALELANETEREPRPARSKSHGARQIQLEVIR